MDQPNYRRESAISVLFVLFAVSGATALVYQTVWVRQLHLIFGTSQFAIATVLAAFMAGLATGGFLMGRYADRLRQPLRTYGLIEIGIGLYALIFPTLLHWSTPIYLGFYRSMSPSLFTYAVFQFGLVLVLLIAPTTGMGATLPLLGRFVTTRFGAAGGRIGQLYGINTAGAVVGIAVAGFFLLPELGLWGTTVIAALGNLGLGTAALLLARSYGEEAPPVVEHDLRGLPPRDLQPVLIVAALQGFAALLYEVSWFRLMALLLGGSTYAFSVMLLAFLIGIAGGGWAGGPLADLSLRRWGARGPLLVLAGLQVGIAALTYGMMFLYQELPFVFVSMYDAIEDTLSFLWPMKLLLAAMIMVPPALLMGAGFPFLVRAALRGDDDALGGPVGKVYGANTMGAIFGAFSGGFLLLPNINVIGTIGVANGVNVAGALVAFTASMVAAGGVRRLPQLGALTAAVALLFAAAANPPPWNPLLMTAGMYQYVSDVGDRTREGIFHFAVEEYSLLYYDEGLSTVVTVAQSRDSGNIWLANNGKVDASTTVDMPTQVLVAHLPMMFVKNPTDTLVIGLASGITLGAMTLHPEPQRIDVVELEPAIVKASRFFEDFNHRPLEDPRVHLHENDGRNHVLLAAPGTYDVVVSEPSNPWLSGVSNLFTREFLELGKSRLKPGGVWSQWIQVYGMAPSDLRALLKTFAEVYPHVLLFATIEDADLVLIGSEEPLELSVAAADALIGRTPALRAEMQAIDVHDAYDLLTHFRFGRPEMLALTADESLNTDDNMRIEFGAPRALHRSTSSQNFQMLLPASRIVELPDAESNILLARAYAREKKWVWALIALRKAIELEPDDPEARELFATYSDRLKEELAQ